MSPARQLRDGEQSGGAADARLRSMAPTLPGACAPRTDAEPPSSRVRRVEWCIDFENHLGTMSTLELWLAIASGRVVRGQRVWREGMECWVPAELVAELRCAFRDEAEVDDAFDAEHLPSHDTEPTPPPEAAASLTPHDQRQRTALRPAAPDAAPSTEAASLEPLPLVRVRRPAARGRAVALGASLAAVLALGMGLASTDGPRPAVVDRPIAAEAAPQPPIEATSPDPAAGGEPPTPVVASPVRGHDEPGQRRLRRGSR